MSFKKVILFGEKIETEIFYESVALLDEACYYGFYLEFSKEQFRKLNHNIYLLYQINQNIYGYQEDMKYIIMNSLLKNLKDSRKNLKSEDILDSVWDIHVNKDKVVDKVKKEYTKKMIQSI